MAGEIDKAKATEGALVDERGYEHLCAYSTNHTLCGKQVCIDINQGIYLRFLMVTVYTKTESLRQHVTCQECLDFHERLCWLAQSLPPERQT